MTYHGTSGEVTAVYRPVDDVPPLELGPTAAVRFVGPGSLTSGRFGLFRWDMAPRAGGPTAHFHKTFSESFYVLSGTVRMSNGREWFDAVGGDFLHVPEGGIHAFRNDSDEFASMLILFAPGAPREEYFQELDQIRRTGRQLSQAEWADLYARHDTYML